MYCIYNFDTDYTIVAAEEIVTKSKDFVMIELEDDKEPNDAVYSPDGGYYPRIVFMTPQGTLYTPMCHLVISCLFIMPCSLSSLDGYMFVIMFLMPSMTRYLFLPTYLIFLLIMIHH